MKPLLLIHRSKWHGRASSSERLCSSTLRSSRRRMEPKTVTKTLTDINETTKGFGWAPARKQRPRSSVAEKEPTSET